MDEASESVIAADHEFDDRIDEQERVVDANDGLFQIKFDEMQRAGQITPDVELLLGLAQKKAAAEEGLFWIHAAVDGVMPPEEFNRLARLRDEKYQDSRDPNHLKES